MDFYASKEYTDSDYEHIKAMCARNEHAWVLTHSVFRLATNQGDARERENMKAKVYGVRDPMPQFFVVDEQKRGFILVSPDDENNFELYFLLVDEPYRRKGILRAMLTEFESKLHDGAVLWFNSDERGEDFAGPLGFARVDRPLYEITDFNAPFKYEKTVSK